MLPVLFKIGQFEVHSYGLVLILAFIAAYILGRARAARFGLTKEQVGDAFFWTLIFGVLGARIGFILQELPYYLEHTDELLSWKFQGLTSFGGVVAGFLTLLFMAKRFKISARNLLDLSGPPLLLAHAIGRVGCLLNGCCYGRRCELPWGIPIRNQDGLFHPAQIYDSLMVLVGMALLLMLEKRGLKPGQSVSLTVIFYSLSRFIYEFWRAGTRKEVDAGFATSTYIPGIPLTEAHIFSLVCILLGVFFYFRYSKGPSLVVEPPEMETPEAP